MGGVFANGLEISGKSVSAKTIAAFPDVCMTPPENPATPPGVPVPYPNFAMAGDTEKGTGKVFIKGKTVNLKNKSDMSKTSGDEAGAAAKKGVITSKNKGKSYFNSWSSNVKFEGQPVVRMSDLTTNNHASPVGNAPPWPHIATLSVGGISCEKILAEHGMKVHAYKDASKECEPKKKDGNPNPKYQQSDHILQNACFVNSRKAKQGISTCKDYYYKNAPCVCLADATDTSTEHGRKTLEQNAWSKKTRASGKNPTYKDVQDGNMEAMKKAKPALADKDGKEHPAIECLRLVCDAYFLPMMDEATGKDTECRAPASGKFKPSVGGGAVSV